MRADDAFWAARIVSKFSDEAIRAIVSKARYSDPRASEYVTSTLIMRRDKVLRTWLTGVNPIVDVTLTASGELAFGNAVVDAGLAKAPASYRASWAAFDNLTRETRPIGESTSALTRMAAPAGLPAGVDSFIRVAIAASGGVPSSWSVPVHAFFRRTGMGWTLVGFERLPDSPGP
jgi:hypothetical protein